MTEPATDILAADAARWRRWLTWRYPHYERMESDASKTLTGGTSAIVRVGFDASTESPSDWHVSLFTAAGHTPDPAATFAAALRWKPAGMILHHVVAAGACRHERAPVDPRPDKIARVVARARAALETADRARADERAPATSVDRSERQAAARTSEARSLVEKAILDGLLTRRGFLLVPPMVVNPETLDDCRLYLFALAVRAQLDPGSSAEPWAWQPRGVAVCCSCTTVFVPRRRSVAARCPLCSKRPAVPQVIGQRSLSEGERQTVRVPDLVGSMIVGWKTATVGLCPVCSAPFMGRRDATTCGACANRARQRRHRAKRARDDH